MRVAVLISGEPRFSQEFTEFVDQLPKDCSIDWFFWLWSQSPAGSYANTVFVAPAWQSITEPWARSKIESNIAGDQHQIASVIVENKSNWPPPEIHHKAGETDIGRCWGMYSSLYQCDLLRQQREHDQGFKYDLVIRTRPDLKLSQNLDLVKLLQQVNDSSIVTPKDQIHGYLGHRINDMFAIGTSRSMQVYTDLANNIVKYCQQGLLFHPETMLSFHLKQQSIKNILGDFGVRLRVSGSDETGGYVSNFGCWA